jgi:hypothetical protein
MIIKINPFAGDRLIDTPLYKLYLFKRNSDYFQLAPDKLADLRARMNIRQKELGILNLFNARMAWSNEHYEFFGVEYYPSLRAVQEYTRCLVELRFLRLVESESFLGIPMDDNYPNFDPQPDASQAGDEEDDQPEPVYRLYLAKTQPPAQQMQKQQPGDTDNPSYQEELEQLIELSTESMHRAGAKTLLSAYMRWNSEEWEYFGIERYPTVQALIRHSQFLSSNGWYRLTQARSFLGAAYGGIVSGMGE